MRQLPQAAKKVLFYHLLYDYRVFVITIILFSLIGLVFLDSSVSDPTFLHVVIGLFIILGASLFGSWRNAGLILNELSYSVDSSGFLIQVGDFLWPRKERIPYGDIINVSVEQNKFDKKCGLYSVFIQTAQKTKLRFSGHRYDAFISMAPIHALCGFTQEQAQALKNEILNAKQNYRKEILPEIIDEMPYNKYDDPKLGNIFYSLACLALFMIPFMYYLLGISGNIFMISMRILVAVALIFLLIGISLRLYSEYVRNKKV